MSVKRPWTAPQDRTLIRLYPEKTAAQIGKKLDRTVGAVTSRAHQLGLRKQRRRRKARRKPWTNDELRELKRRYPHEQTCDTAEALGRSLQSVYAAAIKLGLRKSAKYLASPAAHRFDGLKGRRTRFPKGHLPWNAGKKGWKAGGRSARTRFKKGHRPKTWVPIGTEVVDADGYLKRKVRDDAPPGMSRRNWKYLHVMVWEEANGPVPEGHIVVFKDGSKANVALENLECITRVENMRRNSVHNLPQELEQVVMLRGAINRIINRRDPHSRESANRSRLLIGWRTGKEAT